MSCQEFPWPNPSLICFVQIYWAVLKNQWYNCSIRTISDDSDIQNPPKNGFLNLKRKVEEHFSSFFAKYTRLCLHFFENNLVNPKIHRSNLIKYVYVKTNYLSKVKIMDQIRFSHHLCTVQVQKANGNCCDDDDFGNSDVHCLKNNFRISRTTEFVLWFDEIFPPSEIFF